MTSVYLSLLPVEARAGFQVTFLCSISLLPFPCLYFHVCQCGLWGPFRASVTENTIYLACPIILCLNSSFLLKLSHAPSSLCALPAKPEDGHLYRKLGILPQEVTENKSCPLRSSQFQQYCSSRQSCTNQQYNPSHMYPSMQPNLGSQQGKQTSFVIMWSLNISASMLPLFKEQETITLQYCLR